MRTVLRVMAGFAAGLAAMYLFDPTSGRRRRALARDQGTAACRTAARYAGGKSRRVMHRAKGVLSETRARIARPSAEDAVLVARVRADLGHIVAQPAAIVVEAHDGVVTLRGRAASSELGDIVGCVVAIPGVVEVDNRLLTQDPSSHPSQTH